jgi:hypothetical protein
MDAKLNEVLAQTIEEHIPQNIKPIDYLMDILDISRESAYRRMRGEISFTLDEVAKLAYQLDFTVDDIIGVNNKERIFFDLKTDISKDPRKNFLTMLQEYSDYVEQICNTKSRDSMASLNRLSLIFLVPYEHLFKFYYYKWIHQTYSVPVDRPFAEITMSPEILTVREHFCILVKTFNHCSYVIDRNIFSILVREIQYYYNRGLISTEEILILKTELTELLNYMKSLMQQGHNGAGFVYNFYLSLLNIEANTSYASFGSSPDEDVASQYWIYSVSPVIIRNQEICNKHKKWIESMKKFSALITQSNETLQAEFITKQREAIENITNELSFYN